MASRPSKRQKRPIILSSDDENGITAEVQRQPSKVNGSSHESKSKSAKDSCIGNRALPSSNRAKTRSATLISRLPRSTQASPTASPKKPTRKRGRSQKTDTSKSLYTFFDGGCSTQRSQDESQREAGLLDGKIEEEDLIEDDSLDEELGKLLVLQTSTSSVLDRRKREFAPSQNLATSKYQETVPCGSQKFIIREKSLLQQISKESSDHADQRPWAERYGPHTLEELMVHKKKVAEVQTWLENCIQFRDRKVLLVLKGPSGAGKTATLSAVAKSMNLDLSEWKNPTDSDFTSEGYLSMSAQFEDFLRRSGKFASLTLAGNSSDETLLSPQIEGKRNKIVLLEEFPNTFTSTSTALKSFRSSVLNYLAANKPLIRMLDSGQYIVPDSITPLVMIITETHLTQTSTSNENLSAHRLLGPEILHHPAVSVIQFNPIAPSFLSKALDLVIQKEARQSGRRRIPGPPVLKKLSEVGDVRSAIASLEFLSLRGDNGEDWGGTVAAKNKKRTKTVFAPTKMETESLELVTRREASLGIFHAVGKVVYNKRDPVPDSNVEFVAQPPEHLPHHVRPEVSQVSVEPLMNETGTDTRTFIAALHENYVLSCEGTAFTDSLNDCIDSLSDSDLLCSDWGGSFGSTGLRGGLGRATHQRAALDSLRQDEICFHLAVRGLLFSLPSPVKRRVASAGRNGGRHDVYKMYYPASLRLSRQMEEIESLVDRWVNRHGTGSMLSRLFENPPLEYPGSTATSGVAAWNRNSHSSLETGLESESFRTSINPTKRELILETLPYVTKIERCNPTQGHPLDELEKVTSFHGIHAPNDDLSDEDDGGLSLKSSTAMPGIIVPPKKNEVKKEGISSLGLALLPTVGKLYLSDDDIEDD